MFPSILLSMHWDESRTNFAYLLWLVHRDWALCQRCCSPHICMRRYEHPADRPRPEMARAPGCHFWVLFARPIHRSPDARPRWTSRCWAADFRKPCSPTRRRWNSRIRSSTAVPARNWGRVGARRSRARLRTLLQQLHLHRKPYSFMKR